MKISSELIDQLVAVCGCSQEDASHHLRRTKSNLQKAINDHFDGDHCLPTARAAIPTSSQQDDNANNVGHSIRRLRTQNDDDDKEVADVNDFTKTDQQQIAEAEKEQQQQEDEDEIVRKDDSASNNDNANKEDDDENALLIAPRGRGGRGGGRGRAAAASPASKTSGRGGGRGRATTTTASTRGRGRGGKNKKQSSDEDDDDAETSTSSSEDEEGDDDSSDEEEEDSSSSEETDQGDSDEKPKGRGRGRGRGAAAAAAAPAAKKAGAGGRGRAAGAAGGGKKKAKKNDIDDVDDSPPKSDSSSSSGESGSDESSGDEDDSENESDDVAEEKKLPRVKGEATPTIKEFQRRVAIPFRTAAQDARNFQGTSSNDIKAFRETVVAPTFAKMYRHVDRLTHLENRVRKFSDPVLLLDPPEAKTAFMNSNPAAHGTDILIHHLIDLVPAPPTDSKALFDASNYCDANLRFTVMKLALKESHVLRLSITEHRGNPPTYLKAERKHRQVTHYCHKRNQAFNRDFGVIHVAEKDGVDRETMWFVEFGYEKIPNSQSQFRRKLMIPHSDYVKFTGLDYHSKKDAIRKYVVEKCAGLQNLLDSARRAYNLEVGYRWNTAFFQVPYPADFDLNSQESLKHQLYIRLCSITNTHRPGFRYFNENFGASYHLSSFLASTRDRLWARRFMIAHLVRCFKFFKNDGRQISNRPSNESSTFDDMLHSVLTPEAIFDSVKMYQQMSSKQIFEHFGNEFVRIKTDVRGIPARPRGFTVDLYPHQRRTVAFMMDRERNGIDMFVHSEPIALAASNKEHLLHSVNGQSINTYTHYRWHINCALGAVVAIPCGSPEEEEIMKFSKHRGGILADEVGMGKTLSILSLIALNPATYETHIIENSETPLRGNVRSPEATRVALSVDEIRFRDNLSTKLKVKATLVLAPVSLVGQWEDEMRTRCPNLKVIRYHGSTKKTVNYADIAASDVLITTFETYRLALRDESFWLKWFAVYNHDIGGQILREGLVATLPAGVRGGRYENTELEHMLKSFKALGKTYAKDGKRPDESAVFLSRLHFHRIVMDEFHKSGGYNPDTTPLVDSDNLWLVSGTPLDAPIGGVALKRMGVMDFSFTDPSNLRFVTEAGESVYRVAFDREWFLSQFRSRAYKPWPEIDIPMNLDQMRLQLYNPPPQIPCNYARLAILSQFMIRNTVDTCPELASVRVTQKIVLVQHSEKEKEKYSETLQKIRTELDGMRARGTLTMRILYVLQLLNQLRKAAVDPLSVTINVRDALEVGTGAQFDNENTRRNIQLVPVKIFAHLVFPDVFARPEAQQQQNGATANNNNISSASYNHVKSVPKIEQLKDNLTGMLKEPPELECCAICFESFVQPVVISCGHIFCRDCILSWIARGGANNCPECRQQSLTDQKKKSLLTFPPPPAPPKVKKEEVVDQDAAAANDLIRKKKEDADAKIPTKIKKVLEIIDEEIDVDPTSKFLIFTAFPSVLNCLQKMLDDRQIGSVIIDGSSTLTQRKERIKLFQNIASINIRVCIVSSRVGNMGLTLTAANHLIIVEPPSNIDVDTQILGRVKRLGQQRAVTCHRLHVENSIEVPLYELVQSRTVSLAGGGSEAAKKQVADTIMKLVYPEGVPQVQQQQQYNRFDAIGGGGVGGYGRWNEDEQLQQHMAYYDDGDDEDDEEEYSDDKDDNDDDDQANNDNNNNQQQRNNNNNNNNNNRRFSNADANAVD